MSGRSVWAGPSWLVLGLGLGYLLFVDPLGWHGVDHWLGLSASKPSAAATEAGGELWTCGMHPQIVQEEAGSCPICHMDLVPVRRGPGGAGAMEEHSHDAAAGGEIWTCPDHAMVEEPEAGECPICGLPLESKGGGAMEAASEAAGPAVWIEPAVVQKMNLRTTAAQRRVLVRRVRTVGHLELDPERVVSVTTKYAGFVEKVFVHNMGERVRAGQALFEVYSPDLVQTQGELLTALHHAGMLAEASADVREQAEALVAATRRRLELWDIDPAQIEQLERTGEVRRTLTVHAPSGGVVLERLEGLEGRAVDRGVTAFKIADLSHLWASVELYEHQIAEVTRGTAATLRVDALAGESFRGVVRFLEPSLDPQTRTLAVKIAVANPSGRMRAGMFAEVELEPRSGGEVVAVPSEAVLRTGRRTLVVVPQEDGHFAPRHVETGRRADGWTEIRAGLEEGEQVVTSAHFLIDSESNLRAAVEKMLAGGDAPADPAGDADRVGHQSHGGH